MTTSDLSGCCKPFGVSKAIAESVYEEFYDQVRKLFTLGRYRFLYLYPYI